MEETDANGRVESWGEDDVDANVAFVVSRNHRKINRTRVDRQFGTVKNRKKNRIEERSCWAGALGAGVPVAKDIWN